jgi:hypothetical protein
MPVVFKDFEKDVTDFFDKYYQKGTKGSKGKTGFKLENKSKGANRTVYVNNMFEEDVFTVNFHYDVKEKGLKTKVGISNSGLLVPKITYEKSVASCGDHKLELTDTLKIANVCDWAGEFLHEWKTSCALVQSKSKFSPADGCKTDVNLSADVPAVKGLSIGGSVNLNVCKRQASKYKVGAQYKSSSALLAGAYELAGYYSLSASLPLKGVFKGEDVTVYAQTAATEKEAYTVFGAGTKCPLTGANVRVKASLAGNYGLAFARSFPNNLTVALGVEGSLFDLTKCPCDKIAVLVVRE